MNTSFSQHLQSLLQHTQRLLQLLENDNDKPHWTQNGPFFCSQRVHHQNPDLAWMRNCEHLPDVLNTTSRHDSFVFKQAKIKIQNNITNFAEFLKNELPFVITANLKTHNAAIVSIVATHPSKGQKHTRWNLHILPHLDLMDSPPNGRGMIKHQENRFQLLKKLNENWKDKPLSSAYEVHGMKPISAPDLDEAAKLFRILRFGLE